VRGERSVLVQAVRHAAHGLNHALQRHMTHISSGESLPCNSSLKGAKLCLWEEFYSIFMRVKLTSHVMRSAYGRSASCRARSLPAWKASAVFAQPLPCLSPRITPASCFILPSASRASPVTPVRSPIFGYAAHPSLFSCHTLGFKNT